MSLVRVVIICPASAHTALVSSPSLAVLHLSTYLPSLVQEDLGRLEDTPRSQVAVAGGSHFDLGISDDPCAPFFQSVGILRNPSHTEITTITQ